MKFLINPFFWYLIIQLAGLLILLRYASKRMRHVLSALLFFTVVVATASTSLARNWLEASLDMPPTPASDVAPDFIFVLAGGYVPGEIPAEDVLVMESQKRALHGAMIWRRYPEAHLVFSGGEYVYADNKDVDRTVQLMAETARNRGVKSSAILLEAQSHNTREHPVAALTLPGVSSSVNIGVVTSGWHMRRAKQEFCCYFTQVQIYPVPAEKQSMTWKIFIPEANHLDANTTFVQEWVGILWYSIIGTQGQSLKC